MPPVLPPGRLAGQGGAGLPLLLQPLRVFRLGCKVPAFPEFASLQGLCSCCYLTCAGVALLEFPGLVSIT